MWPVISLQNVLSQCLQIQKMAVQSFSWYERNSLSLSGSQWKWKSWDTQVFVITALQPWSATWELYMHISIVARQKMAAYIHMFFQFMHSSMHRVYQSNCVFAWLLPKQTDHQIDERCALLVCVLLCVWTYGRAWVITHVRLYEPLSEDCGVYRLNNYIKLHCRDKSW